MAEGGTTDNDNVPPLSVFSQSSALMSDRAAIAMEKALRNLTNPSMDRNAASGKADNNRAPVNEDFLRDIQSGQRNYAKRDAADLFSAPVLANDKEGYLTAARQMSLPSAFFSREGLEESAHPVVELSDSEDVNQSLMSEALDSVGSESETDTRDSTIFLGNCATEDLDLVENAILRLLHEDVRLSSGGTKLKDTLGLNEGSEMSSAGSVDLQLLSKLLDQVQMLRDQKYQHRQNRRAARSLSRGRSVWDVCKRGAKERKSSKDEMTKAVEAATQAAKSASEAAKSAAVLVTKNSDTVKQLLHSLKPSSSSFLKKMAKKEHPDPDPSSSSSSDSDSGSESGKEIAKRIVNQNRLTHVVLGLMLVSSFVWRYVVVKVVKRVKNKVSDPWGYVGGILTDNFKGPEKDQKEKGGEAGGEEGGGSSGGLNLPQLSLSPLLRQGEPEENKSDAATNSESGTVKEERILSFGNILQVKPNSSDK